jgi:hypothetical protein
LFSIFKKSSPQDRFREQLKELKEAGYSARALKMAGFPKDEVERIFS